MAAACTLNGEIRFEPVKGVVTATAGVLLMVSVTVWSPNAPELSQARTITVCVPSDIGTLVLISLTVGALYTPVPSTYTHHPVMLWPAVGDANAITLTGAPTFAPSVGVKRAT